MPLYTIQIYDRVISSGSIDTLVALTLIVAILLGFQAVLDFLRQRIFTILGARVAGRLGQPVFEAAVETAVRHGPRASTEAMRDLGDLRSFVAGGAIALPMDLAVTPCFLFVLFLLNPVYGAIGLAGTLLLTAVALATEFFVRRPNARANVAASSVHGDTAAAIRNAEVIVAMGMLPAVARRWRRQQARALESIERGRALAGVLAAAAKTLRIGLQIAVVGAGAVLVIEGMASGGTIVAAAVLSARLLLPFEQLIDGWRQWLDAFAALDRLRDVLSRGAQTRSRQPVAVEHATLAVDRLGFVPPGQDRPLLRNVSFRVEAGELVGVIGPSGAGKSTLARAHRRALEADDRRHLSRRPEHLHPRARQLRRGRRLPAAGADALRGQDSREHRPLPRRRHGRRRRRGAPRRRARADRAHAAGLRDPARRRRRASLRRPAAAAGARPRGLRRTRSSSCSTSRTPTSTPRARPR